MTRKRPTDQGPEFVQRMEDELRAKGFVKTRSGNWVPGRDDGMDLPLDQFAQVYNAANPGWQDDIYADYESNYSLPEKQAALEYSLIYARERQDKGKSHEEAVESARQEMSSRYYQGRPEAAERLPEVMPESAYNRRMDLLPLSSPLNIPTPQQVEQQQQVVRVMEQTPVPQSESTMRMAMRYGGPVLGALLGIYGLAALTDPPREEQRGGA